MKNFPGPLRQNGSIGNILSFVLLTEVLLSVQSLSRVQLFATLWSEARQASLSITNSRSLPKPMSIETHVHRVGDAIQPSHPPSSPSPPALNLS